MSDEKQLSPDADDVVEALAEALRHWNAQSLAWLSTRYEHAKPGWMEPAIAKGTAALRLLSRRSPPPTTQPATGEGQ